MLWQSTHSSRLGSLAAGIATYRPQASTPSQRSARAAMKDLQGVWDELQSLLEHK